MLRRHSLRLAGAAFAAVTLLAWPAAAGTVGPGAPGVGDEYFPGYGNGGYDVAHYDIRLRYWPDTDKLAGTTTILATPTQDLTSFNLDFALTAKSVRINGVRADISHAGTELTVKPKQALRTGRQVAVSVDYEGVPSSVEVNGFAAWIRTSDGGLAVGEPEIAAWWFPSNDHPTDKATFDISVQVPDGTEVLSNGVLGSNPLVLNGWRRWNWRTTKPTATYLAFVAIGQYEILTGTGFNGQPFITAYQAGLGDHEGASKASVERTPETVEFLAGLFGDYPFEAQGGVVASEGLGFALENQTRPTYSSAFFRRGSNMYLVVHENAHQWFGDSVSVAKWRDIWLNEGFATYAEWLWSQAQGEGTAQEVFEYEYALRPADSPFWQVLPGDPGAGAVFHGAVYDRGAMTLHALRTAVGDEDFFKIVRTWVQQKKYSHGTTEEFIALSEQISGKQLDDLFTTWLFTKGRPALGAEAGIAATAAETGVKQPKSTVKIKEAHEALHNPRFAGK